MSEKMITSRRWLLLPIEVKAREFRAKVLLACIAAERGYGVLLGRNGFNGDSIYPSGIYLDKCISKKKELFLSKQVNRLGNKLVSLDEEGLLFRTSDAYLSLRVSQRTIDLSSLILTWGRKQHDLIDDAYNADDKLVITGSPRVDLWRPRFHSIYKHQVEKLKKRYGDYILIPSNFLGVENREKSDEILSQSIDDGLYAGQDIDSVMRAHEYDNKVRNEFIALIPQLAEANKDKLIIVRPHPSDNHDGWLKYSQSWPHNVKIIYEGDVTPWILASKVLIHNRCTTSIEASVMNKTVLNFLPHDGDSDLGMDLANSIGIICEDKEKVLEVVAECMRENISFSESSDKKIFDRSIYVDNQKLSSELIVDACDTLEISEYELSIRQYGIFKKIKNIVRYFKRRYRDFRGKNEFSYAYQKQKNPGFSLKEVEELIAEFSFVSEKTLDIKCKQVDKDIFCIYKMHN